MSGREALFVVAGALIGAALLSLARADPRMRDAGVLDVQPSTDGDGYVRAKAFGEGPRRTLFAIKVDEQGRVICAPPPPVPP